MIQLFPKKTKRPRRYIAKFDTHDLVTDSVRFPSGKSIQVTMEGWYWNNLDWINANTWTTEQTLAHMAENGRENYSFTQALKVAIWQFIDSYDRDVKARRDACQHGTH